MPHFSPIGKWPAEPPTPFDSESLPFETPQALATRCPRRLTLHHHAQDSVDARLVALAIMVSCFFARGQAIVAFLKKVLSSCGMAEWSILLENENVRVLDVPRPGKYGNAHGAIRLPPTLRAKSARRMGHPLCGSDGAGDEEENMMVCP